MTTDTAMQLPAHVRPEQAVDIDVYTDPAVLAGPHDAYRALQETKPDIFYTPRNGGHWIVTRIDKMTQILRDPEHFSSRELHIPKLNSPVQFIPLSLDPPDHAKYRAVLLPHFDRKAVMALSGKLREWADRLIDRVIDTGKCDFAEQMGAAYPVSIFMELMGMPLERFDEFREIVLEYFANIPSERRLQLQEKIIASMLELREQRMAEPKDDLISKLLEARVQGEPLSLDEYKSMTYILFLGGLDTVANALTFAFHHLAQDPDLQRRLVEEPGRLQDWVEESLRMYGVVHQTRIVKQDIVIDGAHFHVGDMVMCTLPVSGRDDRKNPDPDRFDLDRKKREHITFSTGAHTCIGNMLARSEMRAFTEAWLQRIPSFAIAPGAKLQWRGGTVMALCNLPLEWPAKS
jgi:cytochrome P450